MRSIDVSVRAQTDVRRLSRFGVTTFGAARTEVYLDGFWRQLDLLAAHPFVGRPVHGRTGLLRFGYGSHVIFYTVDLDRIVIRRVLHASVDVLRHM